MATLIRDVPKGLARWLPSGQRLSDERWRRRHRAILWVLWPHVPALWLLGVATDRGATHVATEVALLALGAGVASSPAFSRRVRTLAAVLALVGCSSVLVHFTGGLIESHFHFFAVVAFITLYQEWPPFAVAFTYVVGHHGLMGVFHPAAVYNHASAWNRPVLWALIHGGYVALASLANLAAWRLAELERENADRLLDATGDGLYGVDGAGRITFVNPTLSELLGCERAALEGEDHHRALGHRLPTGAAVQPANCPICVSAAGVEPLATGEALLHSPDGAALPVEYLARPLRGRSSGEGSVITLRDLREHHALEARRLQAEAQRDELASIVEAAPDLALIGLPDGTLHWMNPAGRALLGWGPDEDVSVYRIEDLFSAEEMARIYAQDMPLIARGGSWQGEWILQARDGTQIPVAVTQHVHHDRHHGQGSYVSGIMRDLRPRLAREHALRESERRLAEGERVAGLGSWEWDLASDAVSWSPGMYHIHGLDPERNAASFEGWLATVHPEDLALVQRAVRAAVHNHSRLDFTYRAVHPDGRELVLHSRGGLIMDDDGDPARMVGTVLNVTDQHAVEKALRASEERARIVIATAGDAYIQFDGDGLVTDWNRQAEMTFGWPRREALGRPLVSLVLRAQDRDAYAPRLGLSAGGDPFLGDRFELTVLDRSEREFPAEFTVWPIAAGQSPVFGSFVRDISERRAVERAKEEFVSVVSHELRTPLTAIHGALGLLRAGLFGELTDRGQRMVDIAVDNTDRLVRLINDILDIERLDSGKVSLDRRSCDVALLLRRCVDSMHSLAVEAGVRLEVEARPATAWIDPDRIEQTLTNLLSNAIKFSPAGATVRVSAHANGGELAVRVRDEGRGIPADQLETIFGRFQQVDASDARAKGGTGLGLAISKTIVEQHGGRIWAESKPGEGATFTFTVPSEVTDGAPGRGQKVLICDDDAAVREVVVAVLESHGYEAIEARSGAQLVDTAIAHRPAAILLDLLMPDVDGWEAAAALAARADTCDIPILILSVLDQDTAEAPGDVAGWLGKPIDPHALVAAIHRAVGDAAASPTLLLVEDDDDLADVLVERFRQLGIEVHHASSAQRALALCTRLVPDLLVLDLLVPARDGYAVVTQLRRHDRLRGVPLIVYTACDLSEAERERLRLGETRFFTKSRVTPEKVERHVIELLDHLTRTQRSGDDA